MPCCLWGHYGIGVNMVCNTWGHYGIGVNMVCNTWGHYGIGVNMVCNTYIELLACNIMLNDISRMPATSLWKKHP